MDGLFAIDTDGGLPLKSDALSQRNAMDEKSSGSESDSDESTSAQSDTDSDDKVQNPLINQNQSVKQLAKELFEAANSDDECVFSFLPSKNKLSAAGEPQTSALDDTTLETGMDSLFVIDRRAGETEDLIRKNVSILNTEKTFAEMTQPERTEFMRAMVPVPMKLNVKEMPNIFDKAIDSHSLQRQRRKLVEPKVMKKSVLTPDYEQKKAVPEYSQSQREIKKKRFAEKEKTAGSGWFNMKPPEMTEELEADLEVIQLRDALSSKVYYKKSDYKEGSGPKYFQVATVQDSHEDYYTSRVFNKNRKKTLVDELMADAEFKKVNKRKFANAAKYLGKKGLREAKVRRFVPRYQS